MLVHGHPRNFPEGWQSCILFDLISRCGFRLLSLFLAVAFQDLSFWLFRAIVKLLNVVSCRTPFHFPESVCASSTVFLVTR